MTLQRCDEERWEQTFTFTTLKEKSGDLICLFKMFKTVKSAHTKLTVSECKTKVMMFYVFKICKQNITNLLL